ncbi:MAG: site-specific DNA-methyltransferase, partial [Dethiosulfovibrio sp.]|nr:site-specific DNA-methyltransferase [Dethiosulfovibrio sp.]
MEYKKVPQDINDFTNDNLKALSELFPSVIKDGQVDFDALKEELGQFEEVGGEKYELTWSGKQNAKRKAQEKVLDRTLNYIEEDSKNPDTTQNLYIEGDNLEVLKLLRQNYYGSVKMIYIDPPYNTGNDFVYNDNFKMNAKESDIAEGLISEDGERLQKNLKSTNRYHANWLNMMYPRLKVARDLLTDDGVIFISIDDNEVHNARRVCDEVFDANNFISTIVWARKRGKDNSARFFSRNHEYLLVYAKSSISLRIGRLNMPTETRKAYRNPDSDPRGDYRLLGVWARGIQGGSVYEFKSKQGLTFKERSWLVGKDTMKILDEDDKLVFNGDKVYRKFFLSDYKGDIPETIWLDASNAANAADEIKSLLGQQVFDTVKPIPYLSKIIKCGSTSCDIILDFFSGSATTAHAVMQLNAEDGGNRRFIMVQLPEKCDENSE